MNDLLVVEGGQPLFFLPKTTSGDVDVKKAAIQIFADSVTRKVPLKGYSLWSRMEGGYNPLNGIIQDIQTKFRPEYVKIFTAASNVQRLTRRERQTLDLLLECGYISNKEIANELGLSERTVKFHLCSLFEKFRVKGRIALVEAAKQRQTEGTLLETETEAEAA
jgi:DNA-binding CsgD family transcriptional regulator